ncbi:hypothetical protein E2562_029723 [Oryza meyeriana var. granulata]|uniref:Uncharacterized protein n=1 Tax=Oryza meyeriana var. granulata TaxID=110450 RepID=A0A6G1ER03_9ORYZ|nr:hypothetical protein E2562_029723 [Oryza meyeriana var. granulata]
MPGDRRVRRRHRLFSLQIRTEADSISEEPRAEVASAVIDRRDFPGRKTPLHLAVRLGDAAAAEDAHGGGRRLEPAERAGWSALQEARAEAASAVIDSHDVPRCETPLHLAVRLSDTTAAEMLTPASADWSLQNEHGWSALQEVICARVIVRHYQPLA